MRLAGQYGRDNLCQELLGDGLYRRGGIDGNGTAPAPPRQEGSVAFEGLLQDSAGVAEVVAAAPLTDAMDHRCLIDVQQGAHVEPCAEIRGVVGVSDQPQGLYAPLAGRADEGIEAVRVPAA